MSYLLFAVPDQEEDEDCEHNGAKSHNNEREVGHESGNQQQLLYSRCRRIIDHHTLRIKRQKIHYRERICFFSSGFDYFIVVKCGSLYIISGIK